MLYSRLKFSNSSSLPLYCSARLVITFWICSKKLGSRSSSSENITHAIAICLEGGYDVLYRAFYQNPTNQTEALPIGFLCQCFVQSGEYQAVDRFSSSIRTSDKAVRTHLCSSASCSSSPILLASVCRSFWNRLYCCWISG